MTYTIEEIEEDGSKIFHLTVSDKARGRTISISFDSLLDLVDTLAEKYPTARVDMHSTPCQYCAIAINLADIWDHLGRGNLGLPATCSACLAVGEDSLYG